MNGRVVKRLKIAAVQHYLSHNAGTRADPALVLKRTYKLLKREYKRLPYHRRTIGMGIPVESHKDAMAKIRDARDRNAINKFLGTDTGDL